MEPFEDDRLVTALESLRPAPRPAFAAELDERAAAGFPRRARFGASPLDRLVTRFRAIQPRRALVPAGATALAAVAAVTVVVAVSEDGSDRTSVHLASTNAEHGAAPSPAGSRGDASHDGAGRYSEFGAALPNLTARPKKGEVGTSSAASAAVQAVPFSRELAPAAQALNRNSAFSVRHREIERSAQIVLGAEPAEVRRAAAEVFETVHAYRGIVLSSSIRDGGEGEAGARFQLLIPSAKLGDALAAFSGIAEVRSRHEATADITAPTVRTGELLRDSRAKIEGLLTQLSQADTDSERAAAEAKLRAERRHSAFLRSQLASLQRRANLSHLSLRIETGDAASSPGGSGGWGIGDALGDAGHFLAIAAGVTIVGLAVLGPLALLALLAWFAHRAWLRRSRRRALT